MLSRLRIPLALCTAALAPPLAARSAAQGAPTPAAASLPSASLPSASLPPELERVLRDYERAWRDRDAAALAALFAEDGFVLQGGQMPVRGRAAIRAAYAGQGGGALRLRALAAATADTVGYIVGAYRYGDAPDDQGKFTLTLRRAPGGAWLIFSDMDNASHSPRRAGVVPTPTPPP